MAKKKLDELTKIKLIYSGELVLFSIIFLILGILQFVDVIGISERFLNIFKVITLLGAAFFIYDIITTFTNKKKRAKACLLDKFSTILVPPYIIVIDILLWTGNEYVWGNPKYFISPLFLVLSIAYLFQGIYHWFYPLKELLEDLNEENKEPVEQKENIIKNEKEQ